MAGKGKTHQRIFAILTYLNQYAKNGESINIKELQDYLGELSSERQIIYNDLQEMELAGVGITHDKNKHYYYDNKSFTDGELSLLADVICSSSYLDAKSAEELILHIKQMTTMDKFDDLTKDTNIFLRNKTLNSECIKNIDILHNAIREKKQIEFNYSKYNNTGELIKSGKRTVSPYNLVWDNSQCYLIAGIKYKGVTELRIYRADKIFNLTSLENEIYYPISKNPFFNAKSKNINAEKFIKSVFGMYGSKNNELTKVDFLVKNELIGVIYDKFGFDINRKKHDENYFTFSADIQISNMFFGWISSFKPDEIRILNPKKLKQEYKSYLNEITDVY